MSVRWLCLYLHYHVIPLKQCFCSITTAQFVFPCRVVFCSPYIFLRNFPTLCSHTMFSRNYTLTVQILKISTLTCTLLKWHVCVLPEQQGYSCTLVWNMGYFSYLTNIHFTLLCSAHKHDRPISPVEFLSTDQMLVKRYT